MTLLLAIIYLGFISLGLPDSLFGSSWPIVHAQMDVPISYAGFATMTISGGTIIASLLSDRLTYKFGAGKVTAVSVLMTAAALFGFSRATSFPWLIVCAVPLGLGAGAVDAALNNFVALHYKSRHMSWLHCFWGVGAGISPYIMGYHIGHGERWDRGYLTVSLIQFALTALLFASLPLWKKAAGSFGSEEERTAPKTAKQILSLPGIYYVLFSFFSYCAIEGIAISWTSSYLVEIRNLGADDAARFASLFYIGMTLSRFLSGFIADRLGDRKLTTIGYVTAIFGIVLAILPVSSSLPCLIGLFVAGFGCGPIYPAVIHSTPDLFGKENSQAVVGVQMASAYTGTTFVPPLFGLLARHGGLKLFPAALLLFALMGFIPTKLLHRKRSV